MPVSDSASLNVVKVSGLVGLYTATLQRHGYASTATQAYKHAVEHFIAWFAPNSEYVAIGESLIRRFLDEHLGSCDCSGRQQRGKVNALSALRHLQAIFRATGGVPPAPSSFPGFVDSELQDYCGHGRDVCGLAPATLVSRCQ